MSAPRPPSFVVTVPITRDNRVHPAASTSSSSSRSAADDAGPIAIVYRGPPVVVAVPLPPPPPTCPIGDQFARDADNVMKQFSCACINKRKYGTARLLYADAAREYGIAAVDNESKMNWQIAADMYKLCADMMSKSGKLKDDYRDVIKVLMDEARMYEHISTSKSVDRYFACMGMPSYRDDHATCAIIAIAMADMQVRRNDNAACRSYQIASYHYYQLDNDEDEKRMQLKSAYYAVDCGAYESAMGSYVSASKPTWDENTKMPSTEPQHAIKATLCHLQLILDPPTYCDTKCTLEAARANMVEYVELCPSLADAPQHKMTLDMLDAVDAKDSIALAKHLSTFESTDKLDVESTKLIAAIKKAMEKQKWNAAK